MRALDPTHSGVYNIAFDPQFRQYARHDREGVISVRRVTDGRETAVLPRPGGRPWWVNLHFSADGRWLAVGYFVRGEPNRWRLWDLQAGRPDAWLTLDQANDHLDFGPDGSWLAITRVDGSIGVYETATAKLLRRLEGRGKNTRHLKLRPDGRQVAVSSPQERLVRVFDTESGKEIATFEHPAEIDVMGRSIAWRGDGRLLAVGCSDSMIYVWDVAQRRMQAALEGHQDQLILLAFSHDGKFLLSQSWDGTTRLWDAVRGRQRLVISGLFAGVSAVDSKLALVTGDGLGLWEMAEARECRVLHHGMIGNRTPRPEALGPTCVDYSPDGHLLASSSGDGVRFWDASSAVEVARIPVDPCETARFHPRGTDLITISTTGLRSWPIARDGVGDGTVDSLRIGPPRLLGLPPGAAGRASWDREGRHLAVSCPARGRSVVLDWQDPARKVWLGQHPGIRAIALSPDGRWVATGTWQPTIIKVWDSATGELACDIPTAGAFEAAFSPDGGWLAVNSPVGTHLYHTGSWHPGPVVGGKWQNKSDVAFSHDGRLLAVDDGAPMLVDVATGRVLARLEAPDFQSINHFSFSPDDSKLAVATKQHTIYVWDLRAIRRRLAELGLDWDPPAMFDTPDPPGSFPPIPKPFRVDPGQLDSCLVQSAEKPERIVERTTRAIEANPDDAEAHHHRGHAVLRLKRYDEAVADFTAALKSKPDDAHLLISRALAEAGRARLDAVIADGEAALRLRSGQPRRRSRTRPPRAWPASATTRPGPSRPAPHPTATRPAPSGWPGWRWS